MGIRSNRNSGKRDFGQVEILASDIEQMGFGQMGFKQLEGKKFIESKPRKQEIFKISYRHSLQFNNSIGDSLIKPCA